MSLDVTSLKSSSYYINERLQRVKYLESEEYKKEKLAARFPEISKKILDHYKYYADYYDVCRIFNISDIGLANTQELIDVLESKNFKCTIDNLDILTIDTP